MTSTVLSKLNRSSAFLITLGLDLTALRCAATGLLRWPNLSHGC